MIKVSLMNNVEYSQDYLSGYPSSTKEDMDSRVSKNIAEILQKLYLNYPNWVFSLGNRYQANINKIYVLYKSTGEHLGIIEYTYTGGDYKYAIKNKRIKDKRERGDGIVTKDLAKAVLAVKKNFYPTTLTERFSPMVKTITDAVKRLHSVQIHNSIRSRNDAHSVGAEWMRANFFDYIQYVRTKDESTYERIMNHIGISTDEEVIAKDMESVANSKIDNQVYVIRENGTYITKHGDKCSIYTDDDLPEDLKMGMGMLKLCEDKHLITNVGYRMNSKEFMILRNEDGNDKNGN